MRARFTEADVGRILKVARRLAVDVRIEIKPDGTISVVTVHKGEAPQLDQGGETKSDWDED